MHLWHTHWIVYYCYSISWFPRVQNFFLEAKRKNLSIIFIHCKYCIIFKICYFIKAKLIPKNHFCRVTPLSRLEKIVGFYIIWMLVIVNYLRSNLIHLLNFWKKKVLPLTSSNKIIDLHCDWNYKVEVIIICLTTVKLVWFILFCCIPMTTLFQIN